VFVHGDTITGSVNGSRVVGVTDDTITAGGVGFYIATTLREVENVLAEALFNNFAVTNAVPAMTGG
ncbi:MAG: hypothetical protein JW910_06270, partial [Anaerolineae bacterium]|nr:hypothetical protein [Anaerolineae bacterium]